MFEQAKKSLKTFKEDLASGDDSGSVAIKLVPAFAVAPENVWQWETFKHSGGGLGQGVEAQSCSQVTKVARWLGFQ